MTYFDFGIGHEEQTKWLACIWVHVTSNTIFDLK